MRLQFYVCYIHIFSKTNKVLKVLRNERLRKFLCSRNVELLKVKWHTISIPFKAFVTFDGHQLSFSMTWFCFSKNYAM